MRFTFMKLAPVVVATMAIQRALEKGILGHSSTEEESSSSMKASSWAACWVSSGRCWEADFGRDLGSESGGGEDGCCCIVGSPPSFSLTGVESGFSGSGDMVCIFLRYYAPFLHTFIVEENWSSEEQ